MGDGPCSVSQPRGKFNADATEIGEEYNVEKVHSKEGGIEAVSRVGAMFARVLTIVYTVWCEWN